MTTTVAQITTRDIQDIGSIFNDKFMTVSIPDAYRVDARSFIERPFFVDEIDFPSTAGRYALLNGTVKFLPGDIARSNASVLNMFKMAAYGRPDLMINVSMAGTIGHAGCILVGVLPPMMQYPVSNKTMINTILSGPHAFLYANEATSVAIPVPWYCNTDLATTDMDNTPGYETTLDITPINGNYATLIYMVLNPLRTSTGSSLSLRIVVEACFKNFDLAVPTPRYVTWQSQSAILSGLGSLATGLLDSTVSGLKNVAADAIDAGRGLVRQYTGLHNPNVPQIQERIITTTTNFGNNTDTPQFFEKLDPLTTFNRIVQEPIFGSDVDEMAISHIVTKKQFIGTIRVRDGDAVGALKWIRPISPFQGGSGLVNPDDSITCYNNLELMHTFSRAWRGGLKLTIQSVMNNKQQCKLKVVKMYNPSVKALTQVPAYKSVVNAPTHLLEFTQGGQELEVQLPYLCRNDLTPCMSNMDSEAIFHGMYYIYVAQPLVITDSSPTEIEFNLYMSGEPDLTFYGYTSANTYHDTFGIITTPALAPRSWAADGDKTSFKAQSGIKVMNEPQKQSHVYSVDAKEQSIGHMTRLMPNLDIRNYIRRLYKSQVYQLRLDPEQSHNALLPLSSFLGEDPSNWNYTPIETFSRMYYGKTTGFKFRCMVTLAPTDDTTIRHIDNFNMRIYYLPQNINALTGSKVVASALPNGASFVNPLTPGECIPLPFQVIAKESNSTQVVFEFSVPDTSFYKFMGGPAKFNDFAGSSLITQLAQADFGTVIMQFTNLTQNKPAFVSIEVYTGLTDEARFGYHSIAPPFKVFKTTSFYSGTNASPDAPVSAIINPYVYKGSYL